MITKTQKALIGAGLIGLCGASFEAGRRSVDTRTLKPEDVTALIELGRVLGNRQQNTLPSCAGDIRNDASHPHEACESALEKWGA